VLLREAVRRSVVREVVTKPELRASVCESCRKVFDMRPLCNDRHEPGRMEGTFLSEKAAVGEDGRELGNQFEAAVCSLGCAADLFEKEGWKAIPRYRPFADAGATLARVSVGMTTLVKQEDLLVREWEEEPEDAHGCLVLTGPKDSPFCDHLTKSYADKNASFSDDETERRQNMGG